MLFQKYLTKQMSEKKVLIIISCLGLLTRILYSQFAENIIHPDEIIQYAEQAHKQAFGYGLEPWEYRFGIRSWFLPTTIGTILTALNQLGLSEPEIYTRAIQLIASIASCSLIWSCYQITKNCFPNTRIGPLIASIMAAFWIEILVYAPRATPEVFASYALCGAVATATMQNPKKNKNFLSGIMIGLAAGLRYQYLPSIMILSGLSARKQRTRYIGIFALGILVSSSVIALIDAIKWGNPMAPLVNNFKFNALERISSTFGVQPYNYYIDQLATSSIYIIALTIALTYPLSAWLNSKVNKDKYNSLSTNLIQNEVTYTKFQIHENRLTVVAIVAIIVVTHTIVPHKELRFTFATIPFTICLISGTITSILEILSQQVKKISHIAPKILNATLTFSFAILIVTLIGHGWPNNHTTTYYKHLLSSSEPLAVTKHLRSLSGTTSILRLDTSRGYAGGYYYLHLNSRLYGQQNIVTIKPDQFHQYFSHIVLKKGSKEPRNFKKVKEFPTSLIYSNTLIQGKKLLPLEGHDSIYHTVDSKYSLTKSQSK